MNNIKNYKPSENEEYMNPQMVAYFKNKLLEWKEKLQEESRQEQKAIASKTEREADYIDEAAIEQDMIFDFYIADRDLHLIQAIDIALERIKNGEYGYCEETGEQIGVNRLDAWPIANLIIEAQELKEKMEEA